VFSYIKRATECHGTPGPAVSVLKLRYVFVDLGRRGQDRKHLAVSGDNSAHPDVKVLWYLFNPLSKL
jgi:hypothetical protein